MATSLEAKRKYQKSEKGREATRRYTAKRRQELWTRIAALKEAGRCMDCGGQFPAVCMDYDHVRGTKAAGVTQLAARRAAWDSILAEIEKCDLVCANCHRLRTAARNLAGISLDSDDQN